MIIGLLMVCEENDILERTLAHNAQFVDCFYALDGTKPNDISEEIIKSHPKCAGYVTDEMLPHPPFPTSPCDGYRAAIHEIAIRDHGHWNHFLLMHGDEVWQSDPYDVMRTDGWVSWRDAPNGWILNVRLHYPTEPWDETKDPLEQLPAYLGPGWPELRMFRGHAKYVRYNPAQHFDVTPHGLRNVVRTDHVIDHYPFRSPESQLLRKRASFDPAHYAHLTEDGPFRWDAGMVRLWSESSPHYAVTPCS